MAMKITAVTAIPIEVPFEHGAPKPPMSSGGVRTTMDALMVRVDTDAGVSGWGEAFGFATTLVTVAAIERVIGPAAIGCDAADIEGLTTALKRRFQNMMHGGPARFALSALDIALWDIRGQVAGEPIWKLLGGTGRDRVPAYASLLRLPSPELVAESATQAVAKGYGHIKLHQKTVDMVAAARSAVGPGIGLMLDTNCAFLPDEAVEVARELRPFDLAWFEEPIWPPDDYQALARLRADGGVPLAIGENLGNPNDVRWLGRAGAVDIVQPSVVKIGGISDLWAAIGIARAAGIRAVPHSPFIGPGLAATIHVIAAMAEDVICEHRYCDLAASPIGEAGEAVNGYLPVPQGPGLGIEVSEEVLTRTRAG